MTVGFKRPTLLIGGGYLHRGGSTPLLPPIGLVGSKITEGVWQVSKDKVLGNCPCVDVQYLVGEKDGVPQEGPGRVFVAATSDREREVIGVNIYPHKLSWKPGFDSVDYLLNAFMQDDWIRCGTAYLAHRPKTGFSSNSSIIVLEFILNWDSAEGTTFLVLGIHVGFGSITKQ